MVPPGYDSSCTKWRICATHLKMIPQDSKTTITKWMHTAVSHAQLSSQRAGCLVVQFLSRPSRPQPTGSCSEVCLNNHDAITPDRRCHVCAKTISATFRAMLLLSAYFFIFNVTT
ncbi:hypothetical protein E2C01_090706 [Portunus trituberculatus]|uniref:Uncharacterized protein n=1 Tax=Portunus trituberculatus TaxID=210409 RepID=A0A5B7JHB9_PORTR|nr:hypothetical protein [Portunus trituberculatus]